MSLATMNFRLRSFVRRDSRKTVSQTRALSELWPKYGVTLSEECIDLANIFDHQAPVFMEIGFGSGQSLLELARSRPDLNLIGVEMYRPGIGATLLGIEHWQLNNLKLIYADAWDALSKCQSDSLAGVQLFFPDPWPKRRHHMRRLIQPEFIHLVLSKMQMHASLHLATDWQDYAMHMLKILQTCPNLQNCHDGFAPRSCFRPIITKFEQRAIRAARQIYDLQFIRQR